MNVRDTSAEVREMADRYFFEAGRAFVRAYVRFTHLAEEIDAVTQHASGAHPPHRTSGMTQCLL